MKTTVKQTDLCKWDFYSNKCLNVKKHPTNLENAFNRKCNTKVNNSNEIEYVDLLIFH